MGRCDDGAGGAAAMVEAFLAGDAPAMQALLAADAAFHSPVTDYRGRERVGAVLQALAQVVADARLTRRFDDAAATAAFFSAKLDGRPGDGALLVVAAPDGQVSELTLMVRPLRTLRPGDRADEGPARRPVHAGGQPPTMTSVTPVQESRTAPIWRPSVLPNR